MPSKGYGKTVNKTKYDLHKERQDELDAEIQDFIVGGCTREFHTIQQIPKHPDIYVSFSICKSESDTDQNLEEKVFEAKINERDVKRSE